MRLLIKATMSRKGLVPVKRMVSRKGKPFIQTFYVRPDQAPKNPTIINHQDLVMLPAPVPKGPKGDNRVYVLRDKQPDEGSTNVVKEAIRIPDKAIVERFDKFGKSFVVHREIERNNSVGPDVVVTEVSTGLKVVTGGSGESAADLKERAINTLDTHGEDKMNDIIGKAGLIQDKAESWFEDTADFDMKEAPKPITEDDIKRATIHIINTVMDREDEDEDYGNEGLRLDARTWIREHLKTNEDIQGFIDNSNDSQWFEMGLAMEGDLDWDDAVATSEAFAYINNNATDEYGEVDIDQIKDWWEHQGNPILSDSDVWSFSDSNDYIEVEEGEALSMMINNGMSISGTEDWVQKVLDEAEEEAGGDLEDFTMTDRSDLEWDADDLNTIGEWVRGNNVRETRSIVKEADTKRRDGLDPGSVAYNNTGDVVLAKMMTATHNELYRGTGNDDWKVAKVGDVIPVGMASFSTQESTAKGFANAGGTVIVLANDFTSESKKIKGIDIDELIEDVNEVNYSAAEASGISEHAHEHEFIVRAPSITITKVETQGVYNMVYATVSEMALLKAMQNAFDDRIARMESIFDEPLHRKKDEPDTES